VSPILDHTELKNIDLFLEEFYPQSLQAGQAMAEAQLSKSSLRGLETLVVSTTRFSEIVNYIKNQAGRESRNKMPWKTVAGTLLDQLAALEQKAHELGAAGPGKILEVKLRLARGWARQVVTHYLYALSLQGD
jgi:hypothetical protein